MKPIKYLVAFLIVVALVAMSGATAFAGGDFYATRNGEYKMLTIADSFGLYGYPSAWVAQYGSAYGHLFYGSTDWLEVTVHDSRYPNGVRFRSVYRPKREPYNGPVPIIRFVGDNGAVIKARPGTIIGVPDPYFP